MAPVDVSPANEEETKAASSVPASLLGRMPRSLRIVAASILILAVVLVSLWTFGRFRHHESGVASEARRTALSASAVRLKGMTAAVLARGIMAPVIAGQQSGALSITRLVPRGSRVKKGDLLVEFDRQAQLRDFIDKQAQADGLNQQVLEAQAKEDAARAKDETEIRQAEGALSKAKLEMEKLELLSRIEAEKAQQTLDETKATLAQLKETFDLKRKAGRASIRILEIQRDRARETMLHAQSNSALMEIHSPIDGVVVLNTIWKEGTMGEVQVGDQVRPGVPFLQVVDPADMEVQVPVNQEDLRGLSIGQRALVHLDAYSDFVLPARLESVDPMGTPGSFSSKVRNYSATFSIEGHDPRLMPDLSAAVAIEPSAAGGTGGGSK